MTTLRITQTASTIAHLMGFTMSDGADVPSSLVLGTAEKYFLGEKAQKVLLYNPDAIALWLYQKYTGLFASVIENSVMPSVTPVCFASMYSGLVPDVHGIKAYKKPCLLSPHYLMRLLWQAKSR